jgi:hypothetical protein
MKKSTIVLVAAMLQATSATAAELRCITDYYWGRAYSRCTPWFSEREFYEQRQNATVNDLDRSSRGGTRRAAEPACQAALEAGVPSSVTMSYGCSE